MQARQQAGPRRRADAVGAEGAGETHPLRRQAVDVGRVDIGIAVAPQGPGPLVVGQDQDDVRRPLRRGGLGARRGGHRGEARVQARAIRIGVACGSISNGPDRQRRCRTA